jgi:hypothetical protein
VPTIIAIVDQANQAPRCVDRHEKVEAIAAHCRPHPLFFAPPVPMVRRLATTPTMERRACGIV